MVRYGLILRDVAAIDVGTTSETARDPVPGRTRPSRSGTGLAYLYLLPALAVFAVFMFWPLGRSVLLSVQGSDIFGRASGFVGLDNFERLFTGDSFGRVLAVTAGFTVLTVLPSMVLALLLALLLHQRIRAVRFFRTAFALPFAFSVATASVVFSVLYNPAVGVLNGLLVQLGADRVAWLTDPSTALLSVSLATVWMQLGYNLLVLSAGLGAVPDDVVEAARIDGAGGLRLQRSIIVPLLTPPAVLPAGDGDDHVAAELRPDPHPHPRRAGRRHDHAGVLDLRPGLRQQQLELRVRLRPGARAAGDRPDHHRDPVRGARAAGVLPVSGGRTGRVVTYVVLTVLFVVLLFPVYYAAVGSLMGPRDINSFPPSLVPTAGLHPENYANALDVIPLVRQYGNSVAAAGLITLGQLVTSVLAAYAFVFLPLRFRASGSPSSSPR